jgi:hypothetical protein
MSMLASFRAVRWLRTFNLVLQAVLFVTLFGGLNYVASSHPWRKDLTQYRSYSLAPETLSYVKNLPRSVHIVATIGADEDSPEVRGLLDEYVHATEGNTQGRITKEIVDVYQNRRRAEELGIEQANIILLICGDRQRVLPIDELYVIKNKHREAFQGEQALTAALLDVSNPERQHIYFLVGHGELEPEDTNAARGLSALRDQLRVRNFSVDRLELATSRSIPTDASLLIAISPQTSYSRAEQELLRQYLSVNAGRLMLFLAPKVSAIRLGLDDLLLDWGVLAYDDIIYDPDPRFHTDDGDLIVRTFVDHPITRPMIENRLTLRLGDTRTVCPDPGRSLGVGLTTTTLAATSPAAWGEHGYQLGAVPAFAHPGNTHPLPGMNPEDRLGMLVASERVSARDNLPFSVRGGRLVVFGTGDMVSNRRIGYDGNLAIFLSTVNWSVERDRQLSVPARPIERFQLALSASELRNLNYALWFALPGITAVLGLLVYWTRRT